MKPILILSFFLSSLLGHNAWAQMDTTCYPEISSYVIYIDSLNSVDGNITLPDGRLLLHGIAEGPIWGERINTATGDTLALSGGFSVESLSTKKNDLVYLIKVHDNLLHSLSRTYYFKNNLLIFSSMELSIWNDKGKRVIYQKEEYYEKDILLSSSGTDYGLTEGEKWRVDLDLQVEAANQFNNRFKK
jgi:hypothetical protein